MPVSYRIDRATQIIRTRCTGQTTLPEVVDHFTALENDPECLGLLHVLLDLSEITSLPEASQLRTVTTTIGLVRPRVRFGACAIVASGDAMFGMARMSEVFAEDYFDSSQVFRSVLEAEDWLALRTVARSPGA